jgi:hypothetical protein
MNDVEREDLPFYRDIRRILSTARPTGFAHQTVHLSRNVHPLAPFCEQELRLGSSWELEPNRDRRRNQCETCIRLSKGLEV